MITNLKINNYDILADHRVYAEISGLTPTNSTPSSVTVGGNKKISSTVRTNRTISINATIRYQIADVVNDIYSNWLLGETVTVEVTTEDGEKFTEQAIIKQLDIDRFKSKVPVICLIECYSAFLYKDVEIYDNTATIAPANCDIAQHNIKITHQIQADETEFTVQFFGTTTVNLDGDYAGQTAVIDCEEQTCYIDAANRFYLVTSWQDGSNGDISIPENTTVEYKKMVRGVW